MLKVKWRIGVSWHTHKNMRPFKNLYTQLIVHIKIHTQVWIDHTQKYSMKYVNNWITNKMLITQMLIIKYKMFDGSNKCLSERWRDRDWMFGWMLKRLGLNYDLRGCLRIAF